MSPKTKTYRTMLSSLIFNILNLACYLFRDDYSPAIVFPPRDGSRNGYLFEVMCAGGTFGENVFNRVSETVLVMNDGVVSRSYREACPVYYFNLSNKVNVWATKPAPRAQFKQM